MFKNIVQLTKENYKLVLLVFCTLLLMVLVSIQTAGTTVSHQMRVIGEETLNTAESNVSASLNESESTFSNLAVTVQNMLQNDKSNDEILSFLVSMNQYFRDEKNPLPDFLKIYAFLNDEFLDGSGWIPPADYIPQERPWYVGAVTTEHIFFSEPYLDSDTGDTCISFSKVLYNSEEEFVGVLAIDLNIARILNYMHDLEFGNGSYGLVINNHLEFVETPHPEHIRCPIEEINDDYRRLAADIKAGVSISARRIRDINGTDSIVFFRSVFNGWYLGLVIPRSSYYAPLYRLEIILGMLGFILAVILNALLLYTRYERMISIEENRSKSNFLSRMSHEMRTPMNAIIGMTAIAKQSNDVVHIRYCVDQINIAASHLLGIINDILDISKIESGKFTISETEFVFSHMLQQVKSVTSPNMEQKAQNFTIDLDENIPYSIVSDEQRMTQVITNLLSNASKFTAEHGTIQLNVDVAEAYSDCCLLQMEVRDSGIGIEPQQLANLFQPFQQADNTISRRYGGTGLGLAISKSIVEKMGGQIWADSAPGKGSSFYLKLKVKYGAQKDGSGHETLQKNTKKTDANNEAAENLTNIFAGHTILMAEDVEINAEIVLYLLAETGLKINWVQNGRMCYEAFIANPDQYDLILMDIHMPEMDGHETTKMIRSSVLSGGASIPIIAMTANVFQEDISYCLQVGMNDHVGKPIDIHELITTLKKYL